MSRTDAALRALGVASGYLRGRRPLIVNHLVTVRCNLSCPFCYVSGPEQKAYNATRYAKGSEMTCAEMQLMYRQLAGAGCRLAVIVGGEPLLRRDLGELLGAIRGRVYASVFTNGLLLAERAELIEHAAALFVSIDAPDEQHDALRRRPGCFARALAGIERVRRRYPRVKLALNMTVTEHNVARVADMIAFSRDMALPVAFQPPTYNGQFALEDRPLSDAHNIPDADHVAEAFRLIEQAAARGERIVGSRSFFRQVSKNRPTYPCHYPAYVFGPVFPNGDVVACVDSHVIGNVRERSVREICDSRCYRDNVAAGPRCPKGCRDWGIYDISAVRERRLGLSDFGRYYKAFVAGPRSAWRVKARAR